MNGLSMNESITSVNKNEKLKKLQLLDESNYIQLNFYVFLFNYCNCSGIMCS